MTTEPTDIAAAIARLEDGLQGVTPGPWTWGEHNLEASDGTTICDDGSGDGEYGAKIDPRSPTGRHIAACDPDTIRALIASHKALAARVAALEGALEPSAETKAAYMGEFNFRFPVQAPDGSKATFTPNVP